MSLIAHYTLNETANNLLGNNGSVVGGVSWVDGKLGKCADFDGITGYISAPEISDYLHGRAEASIALWVKKDAVQYGFIQLSGYASSNGNLYPYDSTTKVYLDVFRTDRLGPIHLPTSTLEWHHVVITQSPGSWKLYQNGELVYSASANQTVSTDYLSFEIGRNSGGRYADGKFDDVRVYDHALSEREVKDIAKGLYASYTFDRKAQYTENVVTNTNLDTGWSKGYTTNVVFDEIPPPPGVDSPVVGFENNTPGSQSYWYSYSDYAPQEPGKRYAPSVWMKVRGSAPVAIVMYTANNSEAGRYTTETRYVSESDGWKRVEWDVFTNAANSESDSMSFRFPGGNFTDQRVWLCAPQLELNHHTDFVDGIREDFVSDNSGNGLNATLDKFSPKWVETERGAGYEFNGVDTYIQTTMSFPKDDFVYMAWVKPNSIQSSWRQIINCWESSSTEWASLTLFSGVPRFSIDNNGTFITLDATTSVSVGQWYHVAGVRIGNQMRIYVNGVLENTTTHPQSGTISALGSGETIGALATVRAEYIDAIITNAKIYATALSDDQIKTEYQSGLAVDNKGSMHSNRLDESGIINPNILDYTTWVVGTNGSQPGFGRNGSDNENYIIESYDPFNKLIPVWEARTDSASDGDGGWNGSFFAVDTTKFYRFSVWIRRTVIGNGATYLGTNGGTAAVLNRDNGSANGNPYFWSGGSPHPEEGEWVLIVGHVWPAGSGTGDEHPDSGRYTVRDGKVANINRDFVLQETTTSLRHRTYLFYSTNTDTRQQWCYPRVDVIDGTEPSIEALLAGFDSINGDRIDELGASDVPDNFGVEYAKTKVGEFSEVGVADNSLIGFGDFSRTKNFWLNGTPAPITQDIRPIHSIGGRCGLSYTGVNGETTIYDITSLEPSNALTWIVWVYPKDLNGLQIFSSNGLPYLAFSGSSVLFSFRDQSGSQKSIGQTGSIIVNEWNHVAATHDGSTVKIYLNGVQLASLSESLQSYDPSNLYIGNHSGNNYPLNGLVGSMKIFNKVLSGDYIALDYNTSLKSSINKNTAFAKEFIEV